MVKSAQSVVALPHLEVEHPWPEKVRLPLAAKMSIEPRLSKLESKREAYLRKILNLTWTV